MKTSDIGLTLIKTFESLHDGDKTKIGLQPKMDPISIWTIGWGHALKDINGKWLKGEQGFQRLLEIYPDYETITEEEADELLQSDLVIFEYKVKSKLSPTILEVLKQHEFDALVSHTFNTGGSNTLFKLLNNFAEESEIKDWWTNRYVTAGGVYLRGLKRRRIVEWNLFKTGKLDFDAKI